MQPCAIVGMAIGYSAHVSSGGYVPAAMYPCRGITSRLWLQWVLEEQVAAIDETEINYVRRVLRAWNSRKDASTSSDIK